MTQTTTKAAIREAIREASDKGTPALWAAADALDEFRRKADAPMSGAMADKLDEAEEAIRKARKAFVAALEMAVEFAVK